MSAIYFLTSLAALFMACFFTPQGHVLTALVGVAITAASVGAVAALVELWRGPRSF